MAKTREGSVGGGAVPGREPVTRARIIEAALRVMDQEGLEAVTMRRVGRELGIEAMSLYNHVKDKEDLLDGVANLVMTRFELSVATGDWAEDGRAAAREWRRVFLTHPSYLQLLAERRKPLSSVEGLMPMETALEIIRRAGLGPRETTQAFNAFGSYILGFVIMEQGLMPGHGKPRDPDAAMRENEELARALEREGASLPRVAEALPYMAECTDDEQFEFGLDLLIRGLQAKLAEAAAATRRGPGRGRARSSAPRRGRPAAEPPRGP